MPLASVAPDDPVITINNFCPLTTPPGAACQTVVTREQFDKVIAALDPEMPWALRLKVADAYARNSKMSAAAEERGLDKTAAFAEEMHFARMQLLAQGLRRVLQAEAENVSDRELADYYHQNESSFEEATLARIFVPRARQEAQDLKNDQKKPLRADQDPMTQLAAKLRARAANGDDPDKLQIEAYREAGIERTSVNTKMEKVRRSSLPPQHESVMDLSPGEVSQVFSDPEGGHFIYKMISKRLLSLEEAKPEIRASVSTRRYHDSMKPFLGDVVFSDTYFNPPGTSTARVQSKESEGRHKSAAGTKQPQ